MKQEEQPLDILYEAVKRRKRRTRMTLDQIEQSSVFDIDQRSDTIEDLVIKVEKNKNREKNKKREPVVLQNQDSQNIDLFWNWEDYIKNQSFRNSSNVFLKSQKGEDTTEKASQHQQEKGDLAMVKISKNCIVSLIALSIAAISIGVFYLVLNLLSNQSIFVRFIDRKDTIILNRNFQLGQTFYNNYVITTQRNQNNIQINYTFVASVLTNHVEQTQFVGALQKRSEKLFDSNGTMTRQIIQDLSTSFLDLLKFGADIVGIPIDPNLTRNDTGLPAMNYSSTDPVNGTGTTFEAVDPVLPVFKFTLLRNGTITSFSFPKSINKATLGLLRCFVQMFSPLLARSTYVKNELIAKIRSTDIQGRLLTTNWTNNDTNDNYNSSNYSDPDALAAFVEIQENEYNYQTDDGSTYLTKTSQTNSSGPNQRRQQQVTQINKFTNQGSLYSSTIITRTLMISEQPEPKQNMQLLNFDLNQDVTQQAEMIILEQFLTNLTYVEQFDSIVQHLKQNNSIQTMDLEQLNAFLLGLPQQPKTQPIRLLQFGGFQINLFQPFQHKIDLIQTDVLGCIVKSFGYIRIRMLKEQGKQNKLRIKVRMQIQTGVVALAGFFKVDQPVFRADNTFDAYTLAFTLMKINEIKDLYRNQFVSKVDVLWNLILNGNFQLLLQPKIIGMVQSIQGIEAAVKNEESINSPNNIIGAVLAAVEQVRYKIRNNGISQFQPQKQFIQLLYEQLFRFYDGRFAQALNFFNAVKSSLALFRDEGQLYLTENSFNFTYLQLVDVQVQIRRLIPSDVFAEYQRQMEKAKPILDFLTFVRDNGLNYLSFIQGVLINHEQNFVQMSKGIVDLYFRNQSVITDSFVSTINNRFSNIVNQNIHFNNMKQAVNVSQMKTRTIQLFNILSFPDFINGDWDRNLNVQLNMIKSYVDGISGEKGDCCHWQTFLFWTSCTRRNGAIQGQSSEPYYFQGLYSEVHSIFISLAQMLNDIVRNYKRIIDNPNTDVVQKYYELKQRVQMLQQLFDAQILYNLTVSISSRRNQAKNVRNRVGCGGTGNLDRYISDLENLKNYVFRFRDRYLQIQMQAQQVIDRFDPNIYMAILDNTKIIDDIGVFFNIYKSYEDISLRFLSDIKHITQTYNPREFVKSDAIAMSVFNLYGIIYNSLNELCIYRPQNQSTIQGIRNIYKTMLDIISPLSNEFLSGELQRLRWFLGNASTLYYSTYLDIPFCQKAQEFDARIATLYPDFNNFTLLYDLYIQLGEVTVDTLNEVALFKSHLNDFSYSFYKLFTPQGYKDFILRAELIAENIQYFIQRTAYNLSTVRQQANTIYMFMMASRSQLAITLQIFYNSPFTLNSYDTFPGLAQKALLAINVIKQLSFDIIAFVVASKDVLQYFQNSTDTFTRGTQETLSNFLSLCQSFLHVNSSVSQELLNRINSDFRLISDVYNDTVFPNIYQNRIEIENRYSQYVFRSEYLLKLFKNSMFQLAQFGYLIEEEQEESYWVMKNLTDKIIVLIEKLQIGSLNSIYKLAKQVQKQFYLFYNVYPQTVDIIKQFASIVNADFRKLFTFQEYFDAVKQQVIANYDNTINRINHVISSTELQLQLNIMFYQQLVESSVYESIQRAKSELRFDFDGLWGVAEVQIMEIEYLLTQISEQTSQLLIWINQAKQLMLGMRDKVIQKLKLTSLSYKQIRKRLINIRQLSFANIRNDVLVIIAGELSNILGQTSIITKQYFKIIDQLLKSPLVNHVPAIGTLIRNANSQYDSLLLAQKQFETSLQSALQEGTSFVTDELVQKYQSLQDGSAQINSQSGHQHPTKTIILYDKDIMSFKISASQVWMVPIPTAVGLFWIKLHIVFSYKENQKVMLVDYRNLIASLSFHAVLDIKIEFSYGIAYILEFGIDLKGKILSSVLQFQAKATGLIPIQLVSHITNVKQIQKQNQARVTLIAQLEVHPLTISAGFFIRHIWLQIIWYRIEICLNLGFFSFCISFDIPIGFWFSFKQHRWAKDIFSLPVIKVKIFDKQIADWKY